MRPPAFQFYADDFLGGTVAMTIQERGLYITLLCIQWSKDFITMDDATQLGSAMAQLSLQRVLAKFLETKPGQFQNQRMELERAKQEKYRKNRSLCGKTGANKRWLSHGLAIAQPIANDSSPSPSPSPIAEREPHFSECNGYPTLPEVLAVAALQGLAPWKATDWFHEMEGCGWLDHNRRPIQRWQSVLTRVKVKWEADGRPKGPPASMARTLKKQQEPDYSRGI